MNTRSGSNSRSTLHRLQQSSVAYNHPSNLFPDVSTVNEEAPGILSVGCYNHRFPSFYVGHQFWSRGSPLLSAGDFKVFASRPDRSTLYGLRNVRIGSPIPSLVYLA